MPLHETLSKISEKLIHDGFEDAKAGVGIIFRMDQGILKILLVKRAKIPNDPWSGDMAFPGGKWSSEDNSIGDTVKREVMEETGIDLNKGQYLGRMEPEYSTVKRGLAVIPLLYRLEEKPDITINNELDGYYWTDFEKLKWRCGRSIVKNFDVPVFDIRDERVWGLTYRMLQRLITIADI